MVRMGWVVVLVAMGCSSSPPGTQIGSAGGTVTAANGVSVAIPPGALSSTSPTRRGARCG